MIMMVFVINEKKAENNNLPGNEKSFINTMSASLTADVRLTRKVKTKAISQLMVMGCPGTGLFISPVPRAAVDSYND